MTPIARRRLSVRISLFAALAALVLCHATPTPAADAAAKPAKPKVGEFSTTFAERSPLSAPETVGRRIGQKVLDPEDYDVSKEEWLLYVPEDYGTAKPLGLLVLLNYKDTNDQPTPVLPYVQQHRLALVALKASKLATWVKVGLVLDAVHNMAKRYDVDASRVYLLDFDTSVRDSPTAANLSAGLLLATSYSEVITASLHNDPLRPWKPIRAANGRSYAPQVIIPPATPAQMALAKTHPMVMRVVKQEDYKPLEAKFFLSEGFKHLRRHDLQSEQYHYPNYTTDWFEDTLKFFDENVPKPAAAGERPAGPAAISKPATAAAAKPPAAAAKPPAKASTPKPTAPPASR